MENKIETMVVTAAIKSPTDKFYNFFKYDMTDLVKVFPAVWTGVEVVEGVAGTVGFTMFWSYILGGISMTATVKIEKIDDAGKSIKIRAIEGDVLLLYKSFAATLDVSEGLAKWSIEYEKATLITPPPELYAAVAVTLSTLVDAYVLIH